MLVITTIVCVKDLLFVFWNRFVDPSPIHILQEINAAKDGDGVSSTAHAQQQYTSVKSEGQQQPSSGKQSFKAQQAAEDGMVVPFEEI